MLDINFLASGHHNENFLFLLVDVENNDGDASRTLEGEAAEDDENTEEETSQINSMFLKINCFLNFEADTCY
jgi:hypothetical protein